jgi:hypothetical protein
MAKPLDLFGWLKEITYNKRKWNTFTDEDRKTWNNFMIHKYLSMNENYVELVNIVQKYNNLTNEQVYMIYSNLIPKSNVFLKFIKGKKDKLPEDEVVYLSQYFECSVQEVKDYIEITPNNDWKSLLENFETKTTKKKVK